VALLRRTAPLLAVLALAVAVPTPGQDDQPSAAQVKAVFLFNFTQFVEWPREAFPGPDSPMIIGVLGRDPFGPFLDATVSGEVVRGHPLQVRRYQTLEQVEAPHILYVSNSETGRLSEILPILRSRPVLTVGEGPAFVRNGGMIAFAMVRSRIRMYVNTRAAQAARLAISSKLLQVADLSLPGGR
jgi:hypothetical protein